MKNNKILNTTILSTLILFSACSTSQDKLKKEPLSIYNIMGITEASNKLSTEENSVSDITYISYKNPSRTYMPNNYVITPNSITVHKIENLAKSFLGTPYVWGATGPNKFDCSGFTQWVYRDAGINIPRVSRDQARVGQFISYNQLQKGDMIFFDTHKKRTGRVSHVGIYLGSGNFIHASSAGKSVVIYNFDQKPFYKKRFLWGRRVLNPNLHYALN